MTFLRQAGIVPRTEHAKDVLGVVVSVPVEHRHDVLAAYRDGPVRYVNFSGAAVVVDHAPAAVGAALRELLEQGRMDMKRHPLTVFLPFPGARARRSRRRSLWHESLAGGVVKVSGPAPSAFQLSLPPARAVMRRWMTGAAACLLLGAMAACGTGQMSAHGAKLHYVPTSSWRPGDPSLLALAMGTLAAGTYRGQWCVWLVANSGSGRAPIVWPAGFRARRHPLELLDSQGKVVARGGERIKFAGGLAPVRHRPCMLGQKEVFYAMGYPVRMSN